jgi:HAD superfamily hydrolase (TIGR01490 family)
MPKTIAFFDFDGTLTYKDSFKTFLQSTCSLPLFFFKYYISCLAILLRYRIGKATIEEVKYRRAQVFLQGFSTEKINEMSNHFNINYLTKILKKSGLERVLWHQTNGHRVIIVSASFDFLLSPFCRQNNIEYITNNLMPNNSNFGGNKVGAFNQPDCNYEEKVKRIHAYLDISEYSEIYAYGDTEGDRPMLALANKPHFCFFN